MLGAVAVVLALSLPPPGRFPTIGTQHTATVKSVMDYGAFCSLEGGYSDGLCHISQLDPAGGRVESAASMVKAGDRVRVRVLGVDNGKLSLSCRSVEQPKEAPALLRQWTPPAKLGSPPTAEALGGLDNVAFSYSRSGGAGGQNVNKLSTKCEVRLSVERSPWPEAVKERLKSAGATSRSGDVIVVSERHRTQSANREDALDKLARLVAAAWYPPKVRRQRSGLGGKAKRVRSDEKKRNSEKKRSRSASRRGSFD